MFLKNALIVVIGVAYVCVLVVVPGCESGGPDPIVMPAEPTPQTPVATPPSAPGPEAKPTATPREGAAAGVLTGKIIETMNAGRYTYVNVETPSGPVWAAAPQTTVAVGETVSFPTTMPMQNFPSKTLERTFPLVFFAPGFQKEGSSGGAAAMPPGHPPMKKSLPAGHPPMKEGMTAGNSPATKGTEAPPPPAVVVGSVEKAKDGQTIEEILTQKATLAGKPVVVRGKVVKYNADILEVNWLHVQDGTGGKGTNDLTVTTTTPAKLGDTVLIRGTVSLDKDYGAGYKYEVIIDKAAVTVESSAP